jgi:hypothetical protein
MSGNGQDGRPLSLTWHVLAGQNHGPNIPCGASIALVRKLNNESNFRRGAMPCVGLLTVEEYFAPLHDFDIHVVADGLG